MDSRTLIVTRHTGVVEWLNAHGIRGEIKTHVGPDDVRGKHVYGNLPLHLAAVTAKVTMVELPELKPEQRGKDLTPEEMDGAGARLVSYSVRKI